MEVDMAKLKRVAIADEKPVKVTTELPAAVYRDLVAYAEIHGRETGQPVAHPDRLIAPMIERFIATDRGFAPRSEEHTSELQSLMRISYAVFCLKKKKQQTRHKHLNSTRQTY